MATKITLFEFDDAVGALREQVDGSFRPERFSCHRQRRLRCPLVGFVGQT